MRQVSARDAGYLYLPENFLSSRVLSCWVVATPDGSPSDMTAERMVPLLADRIGVDEMFRSVLRRLPADIDLPYWVLDPSADPADHITVHPPTGKRWTEAQEMLAEIADRAFDMTRPLWSVDLITDVAGVPGRSGLATLVVMSFHHAAFDGIALERRMNVLLADEPVAHRAPGAIGPCEETWTMTVLRAVLRLPVVWGGFLAAVVGAVLATRRKTRAAGTNSVYARGRAPITRFNSGVRGGRQVDFMEVDLADVESVAALVTGATTNDALLGIVGGALTAFLAEVGERPAESLICLVPMTTRRRGDTRSDAGPANQFVPLAVDLHTDIDDVVARLAAVAAASRAEKDRAATVTDSELWRVVTTAPALLLRLAGAIARIRPPGSGRRPDVTTVLSTLVADTPIATIGSVPVVSGFGVSPLGRETNLAHLAVISLGRVRLIVTADTAALPDLSAYMSAIRGSLALHRAAVDAAADRSGGRVE